MPLVFYIIQFLHARINVRTTDCCLPSPAIKWLYVADDVFYDDRSPFYDVNGVHQCSTYIVLVMLLMVVYTPTKSSDDGSNRLDDSANLDNIRKKKENNIQGPAPFSDDFSFLEFNV